MLTLETVGKRAEGNSYVKRERERERERGRERERE
jgi:hypothetical protein